MVMSLWHLLPIAISVGLRDGAAASFAASMALNAAAGYLLWLATRRFRRELKPRDGIALVVYAWVGGAAFASIPLLLSIPGLSFTDAYFEAMAGLTATGSTVLSGLDHLPASVNVWRAELQWLGGLGVLVLAVAILPLLGVGGRQIYRAEMPGPMKDTRLTPRIKETAKVLWTVYSVLTALCLIAYAGAGMSWIDALVHAFTTMGLGGFSSHDASIGYFDSVAIETVAMIFMTLAGINFATHFLVWRSRSLAPYRRDPEVIMYLLMLWASVAVVSLFVWANGVYPQYWTALRHAAFNTISVATTTGFATEDYSLWPFFAPLWLIFLGSFVSCSGSTGGGIKMIRAIVLYRQIYRDMVRMLHINAIVPVKVAGQVVPGRVIVGVLAFFFAWTATLVVATLLLAATGLDQVTAFSAAAASLSNIGPGLHEVGPASNFSALSDLQTWICTIVMLLGRLELFTVLILFTPTFWRK
ncbi:MAG: TrkH family potassium uptake protein [Burkholderiales bacterium]|nr:TrkH family potassium uptake protein [Burkholderiales bacterium]